MQNPPTGRLGCFQFQPTSDDDARLPEYPNRQVGDLSIPTYKTGSDRPAPKSQTGRFDASVSAKRARRLRKAEIERSPTCRLGYSEPLRFVAWCRLELKAPQPAGWGILQEALQFSFCNFQFPLSSILYPLFSYLCTKGGYSIWLNLIEMVQLRARD